MSKNFLVNSKQVRRLKDLALSDDLFATSDITTSLYQMQLAARKGVEAPGVIFRGASSLGAVVDEALNMRKSASFDDHLDL